MQEQISNCTGGSTRPLVRKWLLAARIIVTLFSLLPVSGLVVALAFGRSMAKLSPTYTSDSTISALVFAGYLLLTVSLSLGAIWISSRPLLVIATVFLLPIFAVCVFIAVIAPSPIGWCACLPAFWLGFFCIAWEAYARPDRKTTAEPPWEPNY